MFSNAFVFKNQLVVMDREEIKATIKERNPPIDINKTPFNYKFWYSRTREETTGREKEFLTPLEKIKE